MEIIKALKKQNKVWFLLGATILFLLPLWRINIGVDLTDTGYSLGNFENFPATEGMWVIATYLANVCGYLFTLLPFGSTMMGMNFYTGLIVSGILLFSYLWLSKILPPWLVFIGEILAFSLCWCPTAILYNYLTYLFLTVALYFLYNGLLKDKGLYLILAGVILGANVFVRFPNLVEVGFVLLVWYDAITRKRGWKAGFIDTLKCLAGYIIGFGLVFSIVLLNYGWTGYQGMLASLSNVGSEISGYGPFDMIKSVALAYVQHIRWIWMAFLCIGLVQFAYAKLKKPLAKGMVCLSGGLGFVGIFAIYYKEGLFSRNQYNDYTSIFFWAMLFLFLSLLINLVILIKKEESRELKLLAGMSLLLIALTPLGSNNSVYPNFNNLFIVAPVTFYGLYKYVLQKNLRKKYLPMQVALFSVLCITLVQCFLFKTVFTFRDAGLLETDTMIIENEVLQGMKTTAERAERIESITTFVNSQGLADREVIIFGEAPAMAYYLGLTPATSSTWPDLDSYASAEFACSLRQVDDPIVLINSEIYADISDYIGSEENKKASSMAVFIKEYDYQLIYDEKGFQVYDYK